MGVRGHLRPVSVSFPSCRRFELWPLKIAVSLTSVHFQRAKHRAIDPAPSHCYTKVSSPSPEVQNSRDKSCSSTSFRPFFAKGRLRRRGEHSLPSRRTPQHAEHSSLGPSAWPMPVTVACVVMTGESRERDAAVTIAGGFSGAAVPARSGISYVEPLHACAGWAPRRAGRSRVAGLQQRRDQLRERLCSYSGNGSSCGSASVRGSGSARTSRVPMGLHGLDGDH